MVSMLLVHVMDVCIWLVDLFDGIKLIRVLNNNGMDPGDVSIQPCSHLQGSRACHMKQVVAHLISRTDGT